VWTGFYLGGGLGWDWAQFDLEQNDDCTDPGEVCAADIGANSWFLTATAGADIQIGPALVLGVFASYDWISDKSGSEEHEYDFDAGVDAEFEGQRWDASLGNILTVAGRAGWAMAPDVLVYGLAGWSWSDATLSYFEGCVPDCMGEVEASGTAELSGPTLGLGAEAMVIPNLTLRGEYRYTNFGEAAATGPLDAEITDHSLRAVATFRFGGLGIL
jgi:outer membrane immunogenic protein